MNEYDEAAMLLARHMYMHFTERKGEDPKPGLFAPEWCHDYARIAVDYLGGYTVTQANDQMKDDLR